MNRVVAAEWRFGEQEDKGLMLFVRATACLTHIKLGRVAGKREQVRCQLSARINAPRSTIRAHRKEQFSAYQGPTREELRYEGFHGILTYQLNAKESRAQHCTIVYEASSTGALDRLVKVLGTPQRLVRELSGPHLELDLKRYPPDWLPWKPPPLVN